MKRNFSARLLALTVALLLAVFSFGGALATEQGGMLSGADEAKAQMEALYGENLLRFGVAGFTKTLVYIISINARFMQGLEIR